MSAAAPSSYTIPGKINKHKCKVCGIEFNGIDELRVHNVLEHSRNAHAPAGVS